MEFSRTDLWFSYGCFSLKLVAPHRLLNTIKAISQHKITDLPIEFAIGRRFQVSTHDIPVIELVRVNQVQDRLLPWMLLTDGRLLILLMVIDGANGKYALQCLSNHSLSPFCHAIWSGKDMDTGNRASLSNQPLGLRSRYHASMIQNVNLLFRTCKQRDVMFAHFGSNSHSKMVATWMVR